MANNHSSLLSEFHAVIEHGGIVLWIMLGLSVVLYTVLTSTWYGIFRVRQEIQQLSEQPANNQTSARQIIETTAIFELERMAWVKRRIPVISVMIALAPLSGLLGTVSGMLATFAAMADQRAHKPIDAISSGISEALVTTQAGLFMAIPAAILFTLLKSQIEQTEAQLDQHVSGQILTLKKA